MWHVLLDHGLVGGVDDARLLAHVVEVVLQAEGAGVALLHFSLDLIERVAQLQPLAPVILLKPREPRSLILDLLLDAYCLLHVHRLIEHVGRGDRPVRLLQMRSQVQVPVGAADLSSLLIEERQDDHLLKDAILGVDKAVEVDHVEQLHQLWIALSQIKEFLAIGHLFLDGLVELLRIRPPER